MFMTSPGWSVHLLEVWWLRKSKRARRESCEGMVIRIPSDMLAPVRVAEALPTMAALVMAAIAGRAIASFLNQLLAGFINASFSMTWIYSSARNRAGAHCAR
jgi:hypothetical protein